MSAQDAADGEAMEHPRLPGEDLQEMSLDRTRTAFYDHRNPSAWILAGDESVVDIGERGAVEARDD